jgi:hypothetical protein
MESPKSLLLRIQIGRNAPSVEGEPYRNPVGREQAHDAKGSDPSSGISAKVDNEAVYLPQPLDGTRDFGCHLDSDHPWEHGNLQVAQSVPELPCLNQRWLDKMELLSFGPRHIDRNGAPLIVSADNFQTSLLAHSEDRMLWRRNLPAVHTEKHIPWFDFGIGCGASGVDILKYPSLSEGRFVGKVRCAQRSPARSSAGAAVKEARTTSQLQVLH